MISNNNNKAHRPVRTPCEKCPFHGIDSLRRFTESELKFVKTFKRSEAAFNAGDAIFSESRTSDGRELYTVLSGWAFRYKTLPNGQRQILNFVLPSELIGLQNAVFKSMRHSVEALTRVTLCSFNGEELWALYRDFPELAFDVTWIASREEIILDDILASVGRRNALERVAFTLVHLFCRAKKLDLTLDDKLILPITQQHLADALGLSIVHTNKTIQKLARLGLIAWRQGTFHMIELDRLSEIAMYQFADPHPRPFI
jgi:CRP/FNR family transcriptional regulator